MKRIRKALLAGLGAAVSGVVTAAIDKGGVPGWAEVGAAVGLGVAAGWAAWRVPNAAPVAATPGAPVAPVKSTT